MNEKKDSMTFEEYLKRQYVGYRRLSNEFDHYSPMSELYQGHANMCKILLESGNKSLLAQNVNFPYDDTPSSYFVDCRTCGTTHCCNTRDGTSYVCCASYTPKLLYDKGGDAK